MTAADVCRCLAVLLALAGLCRTQSTGMLHYTTDEELSDHVLGNIITDANLAAVYSADVLRKLRLKILPGRFARHFAVDEAGGVLSTSGPLDRDELCAGLAACHLLFDVAVVEPVPYKAVFKVNVTVTDANDNAPRFPAGPIVRLTVSEGAGVGVALMLPTATDADSGAYAVRRYELAGPPGLPFRLLSATEDGSLDLGLELTRRLDREREAAYTATLTAYDGGRPPRSGVVTVVIAVLDDNDNSPVFVGAPYDVTVRQRRGRIQFKIEASDCINKSVVFDQMRTEKLTMRLIILLILIRII